MSGIKIEKWNGKEIRFVSNNGEWWAVATDVCQALGLTQVTRKLSKLKDGVTISKVTDSLGRGQDTNIVNEKSIYKLIFKSHKPEAEAFQDWVYSILKELRQSTGLEGFEIFRMLDKDHQKEAMQKLNNSLISPAKVDFIKANTIANKAVSNLFGYNKMVKKCDMLPNMLVKRQEILDNTTDLMAINDKLNMGISVSKAVYDKYNHDKSMLA